MELLRPMRPLFAWVERTNGTVELVDVAGIKVEFEANVGGGFTATLVPPDSLVLASGDKLRVDVKLPERITEAT